LEKSAFFGSSDGVILANSCGDFSELDISQTSGKPRKIR
jgi:hypothetical protein